MTVMTETDWIAGVDCGGVEQILDPSSSCWLTVRGVTLGTYSHLVFVGEGEDGAPSTVTARPGATYRIRSAG
ncbi:MAG TPA: hypothetical protein GX694_04675 [Actinomycetales bacterium]|nr:hypothetical protein [Actinomycetales bacterium]